MTPLDLKDLRTKAEDGVAFSPAIVLALLDEVERLTRECGEAEDRYLYVYQWAVLAKADYDALKAENERLRAALEPFALVAEHDIGESEADEDFFAPMKTNNRAPRLTVGDLRRAREELDKKS